MGVKLRAAAIAALMILTTGTVTKAAAVGGTEDGSSPIERFKLRVNTIIAGADDSDKATQKELDNSGTNMVPDEGMKKKGSSTRQVELRGF